MKGLSCLSCQRGRNKEERVGRSSPATFPVVGVFPTGEAREETSGRVGRGVPVCVRVIDGQGRQGYVVRLPLRAGRAELFWGRMNLEVPWTEHC